MSDQLTNAFQQRRQLALDLSSMAETETEEDLQAAAQAIAESYSADLILAEIVKRLDTPNSQLRGGLGHLAALLPPEEVVPVLRSAAGDRSNGAQERITAALLLERFVGEPVPAALLSDLSQSNEVAFQSLREAVDDGKLNRHILLEYAVQMRQAGGDIAYRVMDLLDRLPESGRVELLRLIALDDRQAVAAAALDRLERLAQGEAGPQALAALHTLHFVLSPALASVAERSLRKLRFGGLRYEPPKPHGLRCLISPADMGGFQSIWFVHMPAADGTGQNAGGALLGLIANGRTGLAHAFGRERIAVEELPPLRSVGETVEIAARDGRGAAMLEAPFDFGRRRVQTALAAHWRTSSELPDEFKLYCDLIARYAAPEASPELAAIFAGESDEDVAPQTPPADDLQADAANLLSHPAMAGWLRPHGLFTLRQERPPRMRTAARAALARTILAELEEHPEKELLRQAMEEGLRSQAAWLLIAGSREQSDRALRLARALPHLPPSGNPLLALIVEAGLNASQASDDAG